MEDTIIHVEKAVRLMPQSADYCDELGRLFAAKGSIAEALLRFEQAAALTGLQEPAILEMLSAKYSDTRPRFAGRRERTATQERHFTWARGSERALPAPITKAPQNGSIGYAVIAFSGKVEPFPTESPIRDSPERPPACSVRRDS